MLPDSLLRMDLVLGLEFELTIIALFLALFFPTKLIPLWEKIFRWVDGIASKRLLSIVLVGILAFCGSMAVSLLVRFPEPSIHDEFSFLLAADTFASGRLANPVHPLWKHFESIHIIQQPTYASKYPPGQGLALALGQVIAGHPAVGLWISIAMMCASICWMLQGWVPRRWALLGGLLAALNLGFFGYWSQKYWGGAVVATGGALVFGALRRLLKRPAIQFSVVMGVGLIILANSRPFEGLLASLPLALVLLIYLLSSKAPSPRTCVRQVILPLCGVLCLGAIWMGYYNYRVTGDLLRFPYKVYEKSYSLGPLFLLEKYKPESESQPQITQDLEKIFLEKYNKMHTLKGYISEKSSGLFVILTFFGRWILLLPLVMLPNVWRKRWNGYALVTICLVTVCVFLEIQSYPRKLAPVTCLIMLIIIQSLRHLSICRWRGRPTGQCLAGAVLIITAFSTLSSFHPFFHAPPWPPSRERARLLNQLNKDYDQHLIVVRYAQKRFPHFDWVYNRANIDGAKVIWARELDGEQNRRMLEYYENRKIWLLETDSWPIRQIELVPYQSLK